MDTLGSMTRTGTRLAGPASDLVELQNDKGLTHLGIAFHRRYRDSDAITTELRGIRGFMEHPDVCDLAELVEVVPESGAFIYPSGNAVPVAQMLEELARMGEPGGVKAGLELCYLTATILQDAYDRGERHGIYSHGDLSPWRLVCKPDGQVQVLGFGLPQVDMIAFRDRGEVPKEDAFRYCPPERIEGEEEDFSSDLFSLCLIAFEMMVGEPLYNGVVSEIKQQATKAQGPYRLYPFREQLPEPVMDLLGRALKYDIDSRHADINEFVWEVKDLIGMPEAEGPTLGEVVGKVRHRLRRRRTLPKGTDSLTTDELQEIARDLDGPRSRKLPDPKHARPGDEEDVDDQKRWGRVSRSGGREAPRRSSASSRASGSAARSSASDRLRARLGRSGAEERDPKENLKERLRRSRGREDAPRRSTARAVPPAARESRGAPAGESRTTARRSGARDAKESRATDTRRSGRASSLLARLRSSRDDSAPAGAETGGNTISVDVEGHVLDIPVYGGDVVADVVWRAIARRGGPPTSLTGVVEGWFAAECEGERLDGDASASGIGDAWELVYEPGQTVLAHFEVQGDPDARFRAPLHTALTAGAVLDSVLRTLELDGDDWQIAVDGRRLARLQVIGEVVDDNLPTVVVRK